MVSLLNGLSAAGAGIAQFAGAAGLEQQRNNLAQQSAILADQLATTRETALEGQRQTFATGLQAQLQAFQGTQTDKEIAAREAAALQSQGAATTLEKMRENAPTETEKLFRFLKINPDGTPIAAAPTPAGTSVASSDTGGSAPSSSTPPAVAADPTSNPLVAKALGLPQLGSEDSIRRGIAADVKADPQFKYKSAGMQGAEVENRLAIAQGKMTDPTSRAQMAAAIASYQLPPLSGFAAAKPGGPETMAQVMAINPDYQEFSLS